MPPDPTDRPRSLTGRTPMSVNSYLRKALPADRCLHRAGTTRPRKMRSRPDRGRASPTFTGLVGVY